MTNILAIIPAMFSRLTALLLNPTSNLTAAFLLYGIIGLLLLVVLVVAIMLLLGSPEEDEVLQDGEPAAIEEFEALEVGEVFEGVAPDEGDATPAKQDERAAKVKVRTPPMSSRMRLVVAVAVVLVLALAWGITGYTTSDPQVCKDCHWAASQHAKAAPGTDPHAAVACVSCHETGGVVGRYVTDVPARLLHYADTQSSTPQQREYGRVTIGACSGCHAAALSAVTTDKKRGVKISHKEPLAASATCLDCHALLGGVVGAHNAGMAPCLRCHDAKRASAECVTCHDEKATAAARARAASFAKEQIPEVSCGGCHNEKRDCDWCHGVRLPHTREFMAYAHSRAGAVDLWYNGGKTCARCHTAKRRPCQKCHTALLGRAHGTGASSLVRGHRKSSASACDSCHGQYAYRQGRDFCKDVCHTPAAVAASPR